MSANVGLATPRGSGTSGYVQRNLSHLRSTNAAEPYLDKEDWEANKHRQRKPDTDIQEHDRKREIEVKVFELRDKLEEEEIDEAEIEKQCEALRAELSHGKSPRAAPSPGIKAHQVHDLAEAKIKQQETLRHALRIRRDYQEGDHWKKQEAKAKEQPPPVWRHCASLVNQ